MIHSENPYHNLHCWKQWCWYNMAIHHSTALLHHWCKKTLIKKLLASQIATASGACTFCNCLSLFFGLRFNKNWKKFSCLSLIYLGFSYLKKTFDGQIWWIYLKKKINNNKKKQKTPNWSWMRKIPIHTLVWIT